MAEIECLGLLHEATPTAETLEQLKQIGITDKQITVISSIPYRAEMLGRPRPVRRVGPIALVGAILGFLFGLFLSVGIFSLYPIQQGGQPIVPIPPSLIVLFEATMLGTMLATFFGLLDSNVFPIFKPQIYDPRVTEGHIGIIVQVDESQAEQVEKILMDNGAHHLTRQPVEPGRDILQLRFRIAVPVALAILGVLILLTAYDLIKLPIPTQMKHQDVVGYLQGPRLLPPAEAVPIQGPVLIAGQPASQPALVSENSLQRGQVLFTRTCAVCHGEDGSGASALSGYFNPPPANLKSDEIINLPDAEIFLVITQGRGIMPSLAENLLPIERWDVINYIRSLQK
jgi:mono/diheme cytochrome c family protein